jgi:hypothetical protein
VTSLLERKNTNSRYIALEVLAAVSSAPDVAAALRPHLALVSACLADSDPSIQKRTLDVLVSVCNAESVPSIVAQLLKHLEVADGSMRGNLIIKIAVLAEGFPSSLPWYVDTMLKLMDAGGQEVGDDVWHRAVHLMCNSEAMRSRGTETLVAHLEGGSYSVPLISTAGCAPVLRFIRSALLPPLSWALSQD